MKRTKNLQNISGSKWNEPNCSKTFQDQSEMIQIIPKFFNVVVEQSEQTRAQAWLPPYTAWYLDKRQRSIDGCTGSGWPQLGLISWLPLILPVIFSKYHCDFTSYDFMNQISFYKWIKLICMFILVGQSGYECDGYASLD